MTDDTAGCSVDLEPLIRKIKLKGKFKKKKNDWQYNVNVKSQVMNHGTEASPQTMAMLYLSDDPVLDESDVLIGTSKVKKVKPGNTRKANFKVKLDGSQNPFGRYLIAQADGENILMECNEGNNTVFGY